MSEEVGKVSSGEFRGGGGGGEGGKRETNY